MKTLFTFLKIFISLILVITAISYIFITDQIKGPGGELITVNIPKGSSGSDIAAILKQKQVIKNPLLFKAALRIHPPERLSAGSFKLDPSKNIFETIESLQSSEPEMHLTTIPEGLTAEEIAELLAKNRLCLKNEFMALISENKYSIGGKELKSIDGYLFPETYDFGENINCDQIIKTMLGEFERRFYPIYRQHKDDMPLPMTLDKVVILASLVEREAQVPEERPIIAGVYFNRLKKGMNTLMHIIDADLFLAIALILLTTKAFSIFVSRMHMPQVIGALSAGVILGPAVFGLIEPGEMLSTLAETKDLPSFLHSELLDRHMSLEV